MTESSPNRSARVVRAGDGYGLVAARSARAGEVLMRLQGVETLRRSRTSIQISERIHLDVPAGLDLQQVLSVMPWQFLNHSCDPSTRIDGRVVVALRDLAEGDPLTFDYETNESELAAPFDCACGAATCRGRILGWQHLSAPLLRSLRPRAAPYLLRGASEARAG